MKDFLFEESDILTGVLERNALTGLLFEWELLVNYYVRGTAHALMTPPTFELSDMTGSWAYWQRDVNLMVFSRKLIRDYTWGDVVKVLAHETAHQYADCVLKAYQHETAHGNLFKQACAVFRIEPKASTDLVLAKDNPASGDKDRVVQKVHKLLSLAASNNENEANNAMAAAQKLIASYNLDIIEHDRKRHFSSKLLGEIKTRRSRYYYSVSSLLSQFYHVKTIWEPHFSLSSGKGGSCLRIIGTDSNLEIAEYVHDFVHQYIDSHWPLVKKQAGVNHHKKNDFAIGVVNGFIRKIRQQNTPQQQTGGQQSYELTTVTDPRLESFYRHLYPSTSSVRSGRRSMHADVYQHGLAKGRDLVIHKGVNSHNGNRQRLLS